MKLHPDFKTGPFEIENQKIVFSDAFRMKYMQKVCKEEQIYVQNPSRTISFDEEEDGDDPRQFMFTLVDDYCEFPRETLPHFVVETRREDVDDILARAQWEHFFDYREEKWRRSLSCVQIFDLDHSQKYSPLTRAVIEPLDSVLLETLLNYQKRKRSIFSPQDESLRPFAFAPLLVNLKKLETQIDMAKDQLQVENFFIRTSTRSPKDVIVSFKSQIAGVCPPSLTTGKDAVKLLGTSNRVFHDLECYAHSEKGDEMSIIVKPFIEHIPFYEFRCFVHQKRLTAVSQYSPLGSTSTLRVDSGGQELDKSKVQRAIENFMKQIIMFLPYETVVVDVYCEPPFVKPMLIECKPFAPDLGTKGLLFDWTKDRLILFSSPEPVFRFY
jgi:hypothetical protein